MPIAARGLVGQVAEAAAFGVDSEILGTVCGNNGAAETSFHAHAGVPFFRAVKGTEGGCLRSCAGKTPEDRCSLLNTTSWPETSNDDLGRCRVAKLSRGGRGHGRARKGRSGVDQDRAWWRERALGR